MAEAQKTDNLPSWILPTVVIIALFAIAALIIGAVSLVDSPAVSGSSGSSGSNGSNGARGPSGPPGSNGSNGSNGTNGKDAIFQSQFFYLGYYTTENNILGFPSPLPPPVGANLFTREAIYTAAPGTIITSGGYGSARVQPLKCNVAGRYSIQTQNALQGTAAGQSDAAFLLCSTKPNPKGQGNWASNLSETRTSSVFGGQIGQSWNQTVFSFNVGDELLVCYFSLSSPAGWGRANTSLSFTLLQAT